MANAKTPVVLVHGAWSDGSSWALVIGALTTHGFEVLAAPFPLTSLQGDVATLDHTPGVSAPAAVVDIILEAAQSVALR